MPSEKALKILELIRETLRKSKGEYGPTVRELAKANKSCIGSVQGHLARLKRDGYIDILPKTPRGIRLKAKAKP